MILFGANAKKIKTRILHVTKIRVFIFLLSPEIINERQWKNQMADFGNVQNLPFAFFPLTSHVITK